MMKALPRKNAERRHRADAERNRQRLLDAARAVFAERGISGSLEEIARKADLGIGTLYRHFPTRRALIEEIYLEYCHYLSTMAQGFAETNSPIEALKNWLLLLVDALVSGSITTEVLVCMFETDEGVCGSFGGILLRSTDKLLKNITQNNAASDRVKSLDFFCIIAGIARYCPELKWEVSAHRTIDTILKGLS